uniref:Uncharacterized protein n=1 Tax=Knipowitschia caucasica TaxID=637954 RepID=A0AAV2KLY5_KNICA
MSVFRTNKQVTLLHHGKSQILRLFAFGSRFKPIRVRRLGRWKRDMHRLNLHLHIQGHPCTIQVMNSQRSVNSSGALRSCS